ncbi:MAG TPA: aspartate/glutamate racemase family protein [Stellaceae bacterium]|jgi:maleate cis-trans isomerase|nr:aspartate/glutamate racemase family protein [Stellaceae bacterium]
MIGYRARLGFMVPPGNPTIEPELIALTPPGVSVHFNRMVARGVTGSLDGQEERNRMMFESLDECIEMLAQVKPDIAVLAHTATSYTLGREREAELLARLTAKTGIPVVSAYACVVAALERLGVRRLALGAPYSAQTTAQGRAHLESFGYTVVRSDNLKDIANIYDCTAEDAYRLARSVDVPEAQAVFLSGTGMPTLPVLEMLEQDLGKPVLSSNAALMWHALRSCGVRQPTPGYGRLLTLD